MRTKRNLQDIQNSKYKQNRVKNLMNHRYLKSILCGFLCASLIGLSGCSKTPVQKVLDSDPDQFAQAVNGNFYPGGALFDRTECIHAVVDPSYIERLVKQDKYASLNYPTNKVMKECSKLFSDLASRVNANTSFKGLTEKDFEQKALWDHYYQSSMAKFNYQKGDDK